MSTSRDSNNAVIIRRRAREVVLKGIYDDELKEPEWDGMSITILAKDGVDITQLRKALEARGIKVEFEVLPCG